MPCLNVNNKKMNKILVVDNYDSFTYNLVHYLHEITGQLPDVYRNDKISAEDASKYSQILLSPGPGIPDEAGNLKEIIRVCAPKCSILGVCLGVQAIAEVFGGSLINMNKVYHGVSTPIIKTKADDVLFANVPRVFDAARYHSWIVSREQLPEVLEVTAVDEEAQVMALRHKEYNVRGVQFHPESILTPDGMQMLKNWVSL